MTRLRELAAEIVRDAGGEITGRTKLQKIAYLLGLAGLGSEKFTFSYLHYGPYSEDLSGAMRSAVAFGLVSEEKHHTNWGSQYSVYKTKTEPNSNEDDARGRRAFIKAVSAVPSITLEIAATAAYLAAVEGCEENPWEEVTRLKPEKATEARINSAKIAYAKLLECDVHEKLPKII